MPEVNIFADREVHLLDGIKSFEDFAVLVSSVNLINWMAQGLQVSQLLLNL